MGSGGLCVRGGGGSPPLYAAEVLEAAGLTLLQSLFMCVDLNGDGTVSLEEMTTYLRSVFRVMQALEPGSFTRLSLTPDEIAAATAQKCFEDADANKDGSLSYVPDCFYCCWGGGGVLSPHTITHICLCPVLVLAAPLPHLSLCWCWW